MVNFKNHVLSIKKSIFLLILINLLIVYQGLLAQNNPPQPPVFLPFQRITAESFVAYWTTSEANLRVILDVASDSQFNNLIDKDYSTLNAEGNYVAFPPVGLQIRGLESDTRYYIRAKAFRIFEPIGSVFANVIIRTNYSPVPVTTDLLPKSEVSANSIKLYWRGVAKTTHYQIELSTSSNFSLGTILSFQTDSTMLTIRNLKSNTKYFIRIRAGNEVGYGSYSPIYELWTLMFSDFIAQQVPRTFQSEGIGVNQDLLYKSICINSNVNIDNTNPFRFISTALDTIIKQGLCVKRAWIKPNQIDCYQKSVVNELRFRNLDELGEQIIVELCSPDTNVSKLKCLVKANGTNLSGNCENGTLFYLSRNTNTSVSEDNSIAQTRRKVSYSYEKGSSEIFIHLEDIQSDIIESIAVYDVLGRCITKIHSQAIFSSNSMIPIPSNSFSSGLHFIAISFIDGTTSTVPLILQR